MESSPLEVDLYEGRNDNEIVFNTIVHSSSDGAGVTGTYLWQLSVYGSNSPIGEGPKVSRQSQVLSEYYSSLPLVTPGDMLNYNYLRTRFDMTNVRCSDVSYICTELSQNMLASVDFSMMGVPNEDVLTDCFPVPPGRCHGK